MGTGSRLNHWGLAFSRNGSEKKIAKVLVSSDGETFVSAGLPPGGIKPGHTKRVDWGGSSGEDAGGGAGSSSPQQPQQCEWHVKAQYADRSESAPARVNVCTTNDATVELN